MEYTNNKRTDNFTLRDIHVGDWVQVWSDATERYSSPLKVISIHDDGTIYLVASEEERCTPWEENIKNVDSLEITRELFEGFGFEVIPEDYPKDVFNVFYDGRKIGKVCEIAGCRIIDTPHKCYGYFHEFMGYINHMFHKTLKLEWKGVQK